MPHFITRVELHEAKHDDYNKLHIEMKKEGFERTILGKDNVLRQLPTASYCKIGEITISDVIEGAKRAAAKVKKDFEVIATQAAYLNDGVKIQWYNLPAAN